ncbi:protein kinase domain-containing protein [Singulisphaera rosea]
MGEGTEDRLQELFDQAVSTPASDRASFLDLACEGDPGLRAELEALLACDAEFDDRGEAEGLLRSPVLRLPRTEVGELPKTWNPAPPVRIGRYRIGRRIAEGGMGAVYEAEQDNPRRVVALKVVRPNLTSSEVLRRFVHEARILAKLHHPGIAQVYEAGLADDGKPFFAMEFVRGLPLDEFANRKELDLVARVALLARVCEAVQHAHDQNVIHRDLKPANILVEDSGQPKVLDFGVARVTGADPMTGVGLTQTGQLLGTPSYMSPEQIAADPASIDRRADVYALGVILFQLVTHRLPYRLEDRPLVEVSRLILEQDPPRLSSIDRALRGDLETIVAKALEKDPSRRYHSALAMAEDLRRWQANEPILARPPSTLYHLGRFARRHTALVGGVFATALALLLGIISTLVFAIGEARQRGEAEQNARAALVEKREALFQAYCARMAAAAAAFSVHDIVEAARELDAAPVDLRGWEWRQLHSRLDDSTTVIPLADGSGGVLVPGQDRLRFGVVDVTGLRLFNMGGREELSLRFETRNKSLVSAVDGRQGLRTAVWSKEETFDLYDQGSHRSARIDYREPISVRSALSPDGTRLVLPRNEGGRIRLGVYDVASGREISRLDGHPANIWAFAFSADGTRLASAGEDRLARVWDPSSGALIQTFQGHENKVLGVSFSPDGARLLTTSADGTVRQWDVATGRELESPYDRHSGYVTAASYSPDGRQVASTGSDRTVRVWQAKGRRDVAVLLGHTGNITDIAFDPDGLRLASLSQPSMLNFAGDQTIRTWLVDPNATLPVLRGHTGDVYPVAYSPDGRRIASGGWDQTVRLWDATTGELCATLTHPGPVHDLAFAPNGTWLVSASLADSRLRIWDVVTAQLRREIELPPGSLRFLTIRPDGRRIAATLTLPNSEEAVMYVSDLESGRCLFSGTMVSIEYSPDGRWLAVRENDPKIISLLDGESHEVVRRLTGHEERISSASFSPDGRQLASCGHDRTVRVWHLEDGGCQVLRGHTDDVFAAAFHPDGTRLASGGRDRVIRIWNLSRGQEVAQLQGHTSYVWSLAFSPDGATLATGSGDLTVRLWDTAPLKVRYQARRDAERLRPEAERLVDALWRESPDPSRVVDAIKANRGLDELRRDAALRAVLKRCTSPESITSPPH